MPTLSDRFAEKAKGAPYFSIATTLLAPASVAMLPLMALPAFFAFAASPTLMLVAGGIGAFNLTRERSGLSKAFSAAAVVTAAAGTVGYLSQINMPDWDAIGAFIYSGMAMTAGGAMNVAAHYTRNTKLSFQNTPPKR